MSYLVPAGAAEVVESAPAACRSLPSSNSAYSLVQGVPGALPRVIAHMVLRSLLIYPGIRLAKVPPKQAALAAALGSVGIEAFVLAWAYLDTPPARPPIDVTVTSVRTVP